MVPARRWTQKFASQVSSETGAMKLVWRIWAAALKSCSACGLVAEDAVGEVGDVHAGEGVDGVGEQRGVLVGVVEVGYGGVDVAGAAGLEVGGDGGEFFGVAGDEEEACALRGPDAAGGFGDAGGGAEDEDLSRRAGCGWTLMRWS